MKSNKNFLIVLVTFLVALSLPLGAYEKIKDYLSITTGAVETRILNGDVDPSASLGVAAPVGSEYLRDDGDSFKKVGSGDTEWIRQLNTSTPVGLELFEDPSFEKGVSDCVVVNGTKSHVDSLMLAPNNKKATKVEIDASSEMTYICSKAVSADYTGTPIRHKGWITLSSAGTFTCSIVAQWNGANVGNAQIITSGQNTFYDLEVIPTGAGTTGYKVTCDNTTSSTDRFFVHDETSNKAEKLSPVLANIGNVTEWQSFTPTGTWITNTTYSGKWRRVGDSIELRIIVLTSGQPDNTQLFINTPTQFPMDISKMAGAGANRNPDGSGEIQGTGSSYNVQVNMPSGTLIEPLFQNNLSGAQATITRTAPITWGSGNFLNIVVKYPVLGWSATSPTIVMQNETFNSDLHLGAWVAQPNTATCSSAVIEGEANVGKWTTCSQITANDLSMTGCTTRPTQSDADAKSQGLLINTRNYATARPCTTPTDIGVNIGKNFKTNDVVKLFNDPSMSQVESGSGFLYEGITGQYGLVTRSYNPHNGILWLSGMNTNASITSAKFRFPSGLQDFAFAKINASKNPAMSGVNAPAMQIVKFYKQGYNTYRVYNNCYVEQSGYVGWGAASDVVVSFLIPFDPSDIEIDLQVTPHSTLAGSSFWQDVGIKGGWTATQFTTRRDTTIGKMWNAKGFGSKTALQALGVDTSKCQ